MDRPAARLVAPLLATVLLTASCSLFGGGPSAQDEAEDLAEALSAGRLTGLRYDGGTASQAQDLWKQSVAGLGSATPTVRVRSVDEQDDKRSVAQLSWSWRLGPGTVRRWTYDSTAVLTQDTDDAWRVRLAPTLVHPALAAGGRLTLTHALAPRADILGAGGRKLVTERPVLRFGVDKTKVGTARQAAVARRLARAVDVDPAAYASRVRAAGPKAFVEAIVLRPADAKPILESGAAGERGIEVLDDTLPLAATRDFARALLGTVGPVTAETVERSGGVYRAGDIAGLSGLEARYDEQLRGTPGSTVSVLGRRGTRTLFAVRPRAGTPLRTTLDPTLQAEAEKDLAQVRPASAVVAIRPSTGDLLAVANGPGSAGQPTAAVGRYAPGSTFKVVSSLALLRAGVRPGTLVSCPATTVVNGKRFKNYSDYPAGGLGRIPLSTAVANSCNTAFVNERAAVSQGDLAGAAAALGLGVDHDLGFPAFLGSVPPSTADAGGATGHAASMIGQGKVLASPLAMASVAASVARGRLVVPRLLPGRTVAATPAGTPLTAAEAARLRVLMRGVVTRGSGSFLGSVPGAPVLAKTGTAEFGTAVPLRTHAWMVAVHGDLAVAVFVDVGTSGSGTAGPILDRFLRAAG